MFWQTRFLMEPQFQGVYVCRANGYKTHVGGRWVLTQNAYLCSDGLICERGWSKGVVYPDGSGCWYDTDHGIRCPLGGAESSVTIRGEQRVIRAVQPARLQDMGERDAKAEGDAPLYERTKRTGREVWSYLLGFRARWDETAPDGAKWTDNPWVWVVLHDSAEKST